MQVVGHGALGTLVKRAMVLWSSQSSTASSTLRTTNERKTRLDSIKSVVETAEAETSLESTLLIASRRERDVSAEVSRWQGPIILLDPSLRSAVHCGHRCNTVLSTGSLRETHGVLHARGVALRTDCSENSSFVDILQLAAPTTTALHRDLLAWQCERAIVTGAVETIGSLFQCQQRYQLHGLRSFETILQPLIRELSVIARSAIELRSHEALESDRLIELAKLSVKHQNHPLLYSDPAVALDLHWEDHLGFFLHWARINKVGHCHFTHTISTLLRGQCMTRQRLRTSIN